MVEEVAPGRDPFSLVSLGNPRQFGLLDRNDVPLLNATNKQSVTQRKLAAHESPSDVSLTRPQAPWVRCN